MKRTILYERHLALGAKMAPFGGYEMPIQYSGIIAEHAATRTAATIFDTCHMGEFRITGGGAVEDLEKVLSCEVASIRAGQCRYGFITNEAGGVVDDQILYRMGECDFFMVVNASTEENDFRRLQHAVSSATTIENLSAETGKLDLQGPASARMLHGLMELPIDDMNYYRWAKNRYRGHEVLVSRTGYTGELGFEMYASNDLTVTLWDDCLAAGAAPAGLGARDTLRLEMGFPLYGHELDEAEQPGGIGLYAGNCNRKAVHGIGRLSSIRRTAGAASSALHLTDGVLPGPATPYSTQPAARSDGSRAAPFPRRSPAQSPSGMS